LFLLKYDLFAAAAKTEIDPGGKWFKNRRSPALLKAWRDLLKLH